MSKSLCSSEDGAWQPVSGAGVCCFSKCLQWEVGQVGLLKVRVLLREERCEKKGSMTRKYLYLP